MQEPTDPIDDLLKATARIARRIALQFMDETFIVSGRNMKFPNEIMAEGICFEKLETEPSPRRRVAQQKRRAEERRMKRDLSWAANLFASVLAKQR